MSSVRTTLGAWHQVRFSPPLQVSCLTPEEQGGAAGRVIWLDTEGTFRPERIECAARLVDSKSREGVLAISNPVFSDECSVPRFSLSCSVDPSIITRPSLYRPGTQGVDPRPFLRRAIAERFGMPTQMVLDNIQVNDGAWDRLTTLPPQVFACPGSRPLGSWIVSS